MPTTPFVADGHRHDFAVAHGSSALTDVVLNTVADALDRGEQPVLMAPPAITVPVRDAFPAIWEHEPIEHRAPGLMAYHRRLLELGAVEARWPCVVFVVSGLSERGWLEQWRTELAYDRVFAGTPMRTACLYDADEAPPEMLAAVRCAHTHVHGAEHPDHRPPESLIGDVPWPEDPLQGQEPLFELVGAPNLATLRRGLRRALHGRAGGRELEEDIHLAASEVAANAFRHGRAPVSARVWINSDRVVCEISDGGTGAGALSGYVPAHGEDLGRGGMGLWLARKLCDHVDLRSDDGFTVRLTTSLPAPPSVSSAIAAALF